MVSFAACDRIPALGSAGHLFVNICKHRLSEWRHETIK
jgi:hypothetical protein